MMHVLNLFSILQKSFSYKLSACTCIILFFASHLKELENYRDQKFNLTRPQKCKLDDEIEEDSVDVLLLRVFTATF